jgi:diguanylate cyclase (GGDEF)-like protein
LEQTVLERTQQIEHQAFHDKLTNLPNRALFRDRLNLALTKVSRSGRGVAVLFVDLDNFKLVNDSLGHGMGDQLLIQVAEDLTASTRAGDTVARLGGDEFTLLLEDLESQDQAVAVAMAILGRLRKPKRLDGRDTFACASIGVAFTDDPEVSAESLLKRADTAMYRAKADGKSTSVVYEPSMEDHAAERLELETGLRTALENGDIYVRYQPLIDLETNALMGAEALARWRHPTRGNIPPSEFIPLAEANGMIIPIGYWILVEACRQAAEWVEKFDAPHFVMSVNLSGKQLQRDDVVDRVQAALKEANLPPSQLKLEITESVLMADREAVIDKMTRLKALGVQLALDDFGTGYSSLSTLQSFPIDTLKIDRSFISRLGEEEGAHAIVEAILALAKTMRMNVTGEGVETDSQREIIRGLGCNTGQGYLYDRPLSIGEFEERLTSQGAAERSAA